MIFMPPRRSFIAEALRSIARFVTWIFYDETYRNFRLTGETGEIKEIASGAYFGTVEIITRRFLRKERKLVKLARFKDSGWIRLDNDQLTPGYIVERMESAERLRRQSLLASDPMVAKP